MPRLVLIAALSGSLLWGPLVGPASAFTTPFTFHCTGNACRAVSFLDEGVGCTVVTNNSHYPVRITQGTNQLDYVLQPGETKAPLIQVQCYGYYDGGETANFVR